ncbi:MAG: hypothetical protein KME27_00300 [Lyngbya sp. HA4199-MV5]|jgi:hypothetical protein|nr:hypothetical protein [Lyngbya sp. HA4199-MV5]
MKANVVFTPGFLPEFTYNKREELRLEQRLLDAITTRGFICSISGPSKSGKTVLCESVIGKHQMLLVTGGGVSDEATFWQKIRKKIELPSFRSVSSQTSRSSQLTGKTEAGLQLPLLLNAKGGIEGNLGTGSSSGELTQYEGPNGTELLEFIGQKGYALVVDDFHYISKSVQRSLAEQFKEAARLGTPIVVVSVTHRSDDTIRANPDLRGRVSSIDIPYWQNQELSVIAEKGFPLLKVKPESTLIDRFVSESVSSPQLMQAICLQFCRDMGCEDTLEAEESVNLNQEQVGVLFKNTTSLANCKTAFDIILTGPKPRGTDRKTHYLGDGKSGDVYYVILKAIASKEPVLTLPYAMLKERIETLVPNDPPRGVGIIQALQQMGKAVSEKLGEDRVLEWDDDKEFLNIPDPYFLYYLRWASW